MHNSGIWIILIGFTITSRAMPSQIDPENRIIKGSPAFVGDFVSLVSLQFKRVHFCGGNIINTKHILTAAHCLYEVEDGPIDKKDFEVMAGGISIRESSSPLTYRSYHKVRQLFVHKLYNEESVQNDIGIVRLLVPVKYIPSVREASTLYGPIIDGKSCWVAGWGSTKVESPYSSRAGDLIRPTLLQKTIVQVRSWADCKRIYRRYVSEGLSFCAAGARGGDSCRGDSGGGLVCAGFVTGIVSFGFGCGNLRYPGVYVNVSAYRSWIDTSINYKGYNDILPSDTTRTSSSIMLTFCSLCLVYNY